MRKAWKLFLISSVMAVSLLTVDLICNKQYLRNELIRFHVVANSDSRWDQSVKLQVRDAVLQYIRSGMQGISDKETAGKYLQDHLSDIEEIANAALSEAGLQQQAAVTMAAEAFPTRVYETFTLPAGVYDALRITIGEGKGHNWWCVAFPDICLPATSSAFKDAAVGAGFSDTLSKTVSGVEEYRLRFFLLDAMGRVENILFNAGAPLKTLLLRFE